METTALGFRISDELKIPTLLWVYDVVIFVESAEDQKEVLNKIYLFAKNHKLRWVGDRCQVLRIGKSNGHDKQSWIVPSSLTFLSKARWLRSTIFKHRSSNTTLLNFFIVLPLLSWKKTNAHTLKSNISAVCKPIL